MKIFLSNRLHHIFSIVAAIILLTACDSEEGTPAGPPPSNKQSQQITTADVYIVSKQSKKDALLATGTLLANETVTIHPERSGQLEQLLFQEGTYVNKGTLLARLDDAELQAQLKKLTVQEDFYKNEITRADALLKIQGISQEEYDRLTNQLAQVQADIEILKVQLDKTQIRAPFSGRLGLRQISEGAYITPATELVMLQQTNPLRLEFQIPERYSHSIEKGQKVVFTVEGFQDDFEAQVYALSSSITIDTRSLTVRARTQNPNGVLRPGNFAKVKLISGETTGALLIPTDAVRPVLNGRQVIVIKDGKVTPKMVTTGERSEQTIEITEGIENGDSILVSGLLTLRPGTPVKARAIVDLQNSSEK